MSSEVAIAIDRFGIKRAWCSLVANRVVASNSPDRGTILKVLRGSGGSVKLLDDLLAGLTFNEVSVLYEFSLADASHDARKEAGQFFTPDDVAREMAIRALAIDDGSPWIDPCCGLGNLTYWLAKVQDSPSEFLKSRMWLVDQDQLALLLAAAMLSLELGGNNEGVFKALRSKSRAENYLDTAMSEPKNVIMNPPYVMVPADPRFDSRSSRDLYAYFIEHALRTSRGIVAITPQSFTNGLKFSGLRSVLKDRLKTADIYCFDNVPDNIFRGVKFGSRNSNSVNSTRAAILVGTADGKFANTNNIVRSRFRITPLLRWRSIERNELFRVMDNMLTQFSPDAGPFPKIAPGQMALLKKLKKARRTLKDIVVPGETCFALYVPSTPRYFITASKRDLDRSSVKELFFSSSEDQDLAYILLNSNLAYWWWRMYDGGMSLSESTLMSIPIPDGFKIDRCLVAELVCSEQTNLVTKLNAGMIAENVKHSNSLIDKLTVKVLGFDAPTVTGVRSNTIFELGILRIRRVA